MQEGVRVWYFGGVGTNVDMSSDSEEAYLFKSVVGDIVQVTKHSGSNHWSSPHPVDTTPFSFLGKGPCWMHPQVLQTLQIGDYWKDPNQVISNVLRNPYTYDTLKAEMAVPYLLLPIRALFDRESPRNLVKIVYYINQFSSGNAYFDAETGLCLMYSQWTGTDLVFFILSEINYDFATQQAFAEDNSPHTGFKSLVSESQMMLPPDLRGGTVTIQSSVETRYGSTVEMWVHTSECGYIKCYMPGSNGWENYCFFGSVPVLTHIDHDEAPNYPPDQWNPYGQYLWWWVPTGVLQNSTIAVLQDPTINVFGVPMTRTSTNPYTFTATQQPAGFFFSKLWFDNDGYMTQFSARDSTTGLDIDPERQPCDPFQPSCISYENLTTVDGLSYYKNTMGRACPSGARPNLTPYHPLGWSDKIVVSKVAGTNTDSSPLAASDTLYVDWAVINAGAVATSSTFYISLYVDGVQKAAWDTALDPNYYAYVADYSIGSLNAGTHTIKIVADVTGVIDEGNEDDNEYTKTITILSGSGVRRWHLGSPIIEPTVTAAFADALDTDTIEAWGGPFDVPSITFNPAAPTAVKFSGGWDGEFGNQTSMTTLHGLTISGGASLTIENLIIQ